jgi:hypothetical protein
MRVSPQELASTVDERKSVKEGKGLSEKAFWKAARDRAQARKAASETNAPNPGKSWGVMLCST